MPLSSGGFLAIFVVLWFIDASLPSLPSFSCVILPVCVYLTIFPL